jgi:hypothetical protein
MLPCPRPGGEAIWLRNLYGELGFPQSAAVIIKGDNDGSVILSHNPQFTTIETHRDTAPLGPRSCVQPNPGYPEL